ncbi:hypothetical protein AVEN_68296-1 [Araneus ventricosus]|uniref:Uncharacterized protein n=1 Tax=Araneus ventricosus TaxID=182803 RepID=A0A4Y2HLB6_ARAVE|nr:hypothetical protein AVEN_68296-1 [Araneus ventricosus]
MNCEFGKFLNDSLRDRFVCGLRSEAIQKMLLSEADLSYKKAVNITIAMRTAARDDYKLHTIRDYKVYHTQKSTKCSRSSSGFLDCQQNRELKPVRDKTRRRFRGRCFRCRSPLPFANAYQDKDKECKNVTLKDRLNPSAELN